MLDLTMSDMFASPA
ncbi:Protein of unknown function [Bacillus cereus]|nr:Protein of unknown function [Bacillus cereus]